MASEVEQKGNTWKPRILPYDRLTVQVSFFLSLIILLISCRIHHVYITYYIWPICVMHVLLQYTSLEPIIECIYKCLYFYFQRIRTRRPANASGVRGQTAAKSTKNISNDTGQDFQTLGPAWEPGDRTTPSSSSCRKYICALHLSGFGCNYVYIGCNKFCWVFQGSCWFKQYFILINIHIHVHVGNKDICNDFTCLILIYNLFYVNYSELQQTRKIPIFPMWIIRIGLCKIRIFYITTIYQNLLKYTL